MSPTQIVLLVIIVTASGFVSGISGFGYALAATPLCSMVIAPSEAVILITLCGMTPAVQNFARFHKDIDRAVAKRMMAASVLGMPLGLVVLEVFGDAPLRLTIGITTLTIGMLLLLGVDLHRANRYTDVTLGFVSGVLNTSTGTNGPPLVIGLRAHNLDIPRFRGTISVLFVIAQAMALVLFGVRGRIHLDLVWLALAVVPLITLVTFAGQRLSLRLGKRRFDHLVLGLLLASGGAALINAVVSLLNR
jgi:hypothetical protein